jgi:multidrug efflux system outer membrane protein
MPKSVSAALMKRKGREPIASLPALVVFLLFLFLSGCAVGPNYRRPNVNTPAVFRGASGAAQQASIADLPWWEVFKDETLKDLIKTSLANNYDLEAAIARVEQARQVAAEARSQYFPAINYSTVITYGHNQFINSPVSISPGAQGFLLAIASATWEADLWGRIRRMNEGARAQYLATEEARRGVMLTLASDVSQAYFELLGLRLQLDIARETIQSYTATLKLFNDRLQEGLGNALQTSRATADLAVAAASARDLERLIALKENQISVLMGKNPGAIETKVKLLEETVPPAIPAGLPSALLERRPDVLAAAQKVRYANAQVGVAKSAYFPRIGLTTFFGKLSTPLADVTSGNTNAWSLGANISGPIFQGGAIKAQNRQAVAYWEEARVQYLQTALSAFRDVADALVSREQFDNIREDLIRGVQSSEEAVRLARMRYVEGLSNYNEVLEAQQRLYPAQLSLAQTEISRRLVVVQLYKALGGGWNLTDAQWIAATSPPGAHSPPPGRKP